MSLKLKILAGLLSDIVNGYLKKTLHTLAGSQAVIFQILHLILRQMWTFFFFY